MAQNDSQDSKVVVSAPSKGPGLFSRVPVLRFLGKGRQAVMIVVAVVVVGLGVGGYLIYKHHAQSPSPSTKAENETQQLNEALLKGDKVKALQLAKQVLASEPNNIDNILTVASLSKASDPNAAAQYYLQAFDEFKKQNNPDANGKPIAVYWAAAGLAEQAGQTSQAKIYYQKVIKVAKVHDSYEQSLVAQSKAALKRLK